MKKQELEAEYRRLSEVYKTRVAEEEKNLLLFSVLRLVCFIGGLLTVIFLAASHHAVLSVVSAFLFLFVFLWLLRIFSRHTEKKEICANLSAINQNEADALNGDVSKFRAGSRFISTGHDYSYDIDLFGENSLFNYLNRTVTGYGEEVLADWLSDPYLLAPGLLKRQEIIKELAAKPGWRQEFMASGMSVPVDNVHATGLNEWLHSSVRLSSFRRVMIFVLPAVTLASFILFAAGLIHYSIVTLIILFNLGYVGSDLRQTNHVHSLLSGRYSWLSSLQKLLRLFGNERFVSGHLNEMQNKISGKDDSASLSVRKLGRIIEGFDTRLNIIAGFALNAVLLWDYHCIMRLEKWKAENREKFMDWIKIIGEIDAYSSFGNYAYNNPGFAWPETSGEIVLNAEKMGHPLIAEEKRVSNDFRIERNGRICIITGANMAGKSTFLRTVAVNYILAMSGAPVCASGFIFKPVRLFTSMRTTDSLAGNESYFYAELKRLRTLRTKIAGDESVFFILDEILKGTNSADKALGSKLFLDKIIQHRGTGMIATHDISLAALEKEHPENVFNMCFEVEIDGENISFDYKLRRGITSKMNAALLMRQIGILD